jgi:hypothetical protein
LPLRRRAGSSREGEEDLTRDSDFSHQSAMKDPLADASRLSVSLFD